MHEHPNIERFTGFADTYDQYRPQPPAIVTTILAQIAQVERPRLVVDVGSGTGLSSVIWAGCTDQVVGIEPNPDMRAVAEAKSAEYANVRFAADLSTATGLPDGCADIVVCTQSFHWMEPEPSLAEFARVLRDGGVFAAIDCDWPPVIQWEVEAAWRSYSSRMRALVSERPELSRAHQAPKERHLDRIVESGHFRYTREFAACASEPSSAERVIGLALSMGSVQDLLKHGLSEDEIGLTDYRRAVRSILGDRELPWYLTYRVRLGVK